MEPSVEPVSARTRWRFTFVLSIKVHTKILVIFIAIITDTLSSWSKYFSICGRFFNATPFLFDLFLSQSKSEFVVLIRLAIYYLSGRNIAMAILLYSSNSLQPSLNTFLVLGFFGMGSKVRRTHRNPREKWRRTRSFKAPPVLVPASSSRLHKKE